MIISYIPEHLAIISAEEMKEGWDGIEPAEAAAAAVRGDAADVTEGAEEVAKTIANSIPTKTLSL